MSKGELQSIVIATIAAAVVSPLLGRLLSRAFPPKNHDQNSLDKTTGWQNLKNRIIGYSSVVFIFGGMSVPFLFQGTDRLKPTASNVALIFSLGLLFMIGGTIALANLLGDRKAEAFLAYVERKQNISREGVRKMTKVTAILATTILLATLLLAF